MIDWNTCPCVELNPELVSGAIINEFVELFPGVELIHARSVLEHAAKSAMAVH
jgi:hypothetical protein